MRAAALLLLFVACHAPASPLSNAPPPGLALTIYDTRALVDDRRWLEVDGPTVTLDRVDPRAELDSLVVAASGLRIGTCTRDELPAAPPRFVPAVRCRVTGAAGRYLVRVAYFTPGFHYDARHDVDVLAAGRAIVRSRYTLATPAWHERADVRLIAGTPGGARPPRELARGTVLLDGSVAVLAAPPREVAAELRRVVVASPDSSDDASDRGVEPAGVWLELVLAGGALAPGHAVVHVGPRDAESATVDPALALWPDPSLRALRRHDLEPVAGAMLAERFTFSIANTGDEPREVSIEEPVREDRAAHLVHAIGKPALVGHVVRATLAVAPRALGEVAFTVVYDE